jgi:hypothetical protein
MLGELRLVEKKMSGGNPTVPGNDEIRVSKVDMAYDMAVVSPLWTVCRLR